MSAVTSESRPSIEADSTRGRGYGSEQNDSLVPLDNQLRVETPEKIAFQHALAGPFQRGIAFVLDLLLVQIGYWVVVVLLAFLFLWILGTVGMINRTLADVLGGLGAALVLVGAFLVTWFYGAYFETVYNGRTLGKMLCRQRVLSATGGSIDATQALLRNFFRAVDMFPFVNAGILWGTLGFEGFFLPTGLAGLIVMCVNGQYRRIGDLVAGTIVISEDPRVAGNLAQFDDDRVARLAEMIPADFVVDRSLARALSSYVERRKYFGPKRVEEIANRLAPILINRFGLMESTNSDLFLCAMYHRTFLTTRSDEAEAAGKGKPIAAPLSNVSSRVESSVPSGPT